MLTLKKNNAQKDIDHYLTLNRYAGELRINFSLIDKNNLIKKLIQNTYLCEPAK
jgi:hypothetical protein